jgi:hypothetical protein
MQRAVKGWRLLAWSLEAGTYFGFLGSTGLLVSLALSFCLWLKDCRVQVCFRMKVSADPVPAFRVLNVVEKVQGKTKAET